MHALRSAAHLLIFCLLLAPGHAAAGLLANGDIEQGGVTTAVGWSTDIQREKYEFAIGAEAHSGQRCLEIRAGAGVTDGWSRWYTTDLFLLGGAVYRLRAQVRVGPGGLGQLNVPSGALGFERTLLPADGWQAVDVEFRVAATGRCGLYLQSLRGGVVAFDDLTLELVTPPPPAAAGEPVPTDGAPIAALVVPDATAPVHGYLALELQRIFGKLTGRTPAVVSAGSLPGDDAQRRLWIGCAPPGRSYRVELASVGDEGIVLVVDPQAVVCLGNSPRAVYYAVHELLHRIGCRWLQPGPLGEVLPPAGPLKLAPCRLVHRPSFEIRGGHTIQVYHTPPEWKPVHVNTDEWVDWAARNRMNRLKASYTTPWDYGAIRGGSEDEIAGHSLYATIPPARFFAAHPEWYPLVQGKRTHVHSSGREAEICVTAPGLVEYVADTICDWFASHPNAKRYCVNAEDEPSYWCECEQCRALDTEPIDWSKNGQGVLPLTDRWLTFINRIAERVERRYPERWVATFAYASSRELPRRVKPRRNVMIELTWWDQCFKHRVTDPKCATNRKGLARYDGWHKLAPVAVYRYLDYIHMECPGPYFAAEADMLRTLSKRGCRWLSDEWDTTFTASGPLLDLRARLAWDVNTDPVAFLDDYCAHAYGPAGEVMARYWRRLARAVREAPSKHVGLNDLGKFTPGVLVEGEALLDQAAGLADSDAARAMVDQQRFALDFVRLDQLADVVAKEPARFPEQAAVQQRMWRLAQARGIAPVVWYLERFRTNYRPPLEALAGRRVVELPETWRFRPDPDKVGEAEQWFTTTPDDAWKPISTHRAWEEQAWPGYDGDAWYVLDVNLPALPEPRVWLLFEAVDETFRLWINGVEVGGSDGDPGVLWDKPVAVEITGKYRPGEVNHLVAKVHDIGWAGGIWKPVWVVGG